VYSAFCVLSPIVILTAVTITYFRQQYIRAPPELSRSLYSVMSVLRLFLGKLTDDDDERAAQIIIKTKKQLAYSKPVAYK